MHIEIKAFSKETNNLNKVIMKHDKEFNDIYYLYMIAVHGFALIGLIRCLSLIGFTI